MHFAGYLDVAESVADPLKYHQNNVAATLALLGALSSMGVRRFVFSSSASVYGSAREVPISEDAPCAPENPYGRTKRVIEEVLTDLEHVGALRAFSLRYFNAAGPRGCPSSDTTPRPTSSRSRCRPPSGGATRW
ncbi:MAG: GDP-mannose 4,6-dehydratase [Polyangiales bacterium]